MVAVRTQWATINANGVPRVLKAVYENDAIPVLGMEATLQLVIPINQCIAEPTYALVLKKQGSRAQLVGELEQLKLHRNVHHAVEVEQRHVQIVLVQEQNHVLLAMVKELQQIQIIVVILVGLPTILVRIMEKM